MKFTNKHNLPDYLESYLKRFYKPDPYRIGVTTLIDEPLPRILIMQNWDKLVIDVVDFFNTIKGQGIHSLFQDKLPKIEVQQGKFTIVGEADKEFLNNCIDIKVTSVWTLIYKSKIKDYEKQLNLYDWLKVKKYGQGFEKLIVDMFFDDWKVGKTKQKGNWDYPKIPFKRLEVKKWSFEQQETYVAERLAIHEAALTAEKPPECSREGKWQSDDKFAVMRKGRKSAVRVFDTQQEAEKYPKKSGDYIQTRPGECRRCLDYCIANKYCPFFLGDF